MHNKHANTTMATTTRKADLIAAVKTAETPEERSEAVRELAAYNIKANQDVFDSLARK
jgi:hypothetical protein